MEATETSTDPEVSSVGTSSVSVVCPPGGVHQARLGEARQQTVQATEQSPAGYVILVSETLSLGCKAPSLLPQRKMKIRVYELKESNRIWAFLLLTKERSRLREGKWVAQEPAIIPRKHSEGAERAGQEC